MFLETGIEAFFTLFFCGLVILFFFLRHLRRKALVKSVANGAFIDRYFESHPELRDEEFIPYRSKPVNRLHDNIFMAKTFCIFVEGLKVRRVDYDKIYWVYGEVVAADKITKKSGMEVLCLCTTKGRYRIVVKRQNPYVSYLAQMQIPAGYNEKIKQIALEYKNKIKEKKHD